MREQATRTIDDLKWAAAAAFGESTRIRSHWQLGRTKIMGLIRTPSLAMLTSAALRTAAYADCGIESGRVNVFADDFPTMTAAMETAPNPPTTG